MSWDLAPKTILSSHWHKALLIMERNVLAHYFRKGCQKETARFEIAVHTFPGLLERVVHFICLALPLPIEYSYRRENTHIGKNNACSFMWWDYSREMILLVIRVVYMIMLSYHNNLCMYRPLHICKISIGIEETDIQLLFPWLAKLEFHIVQSRILPHLLFLFERPPAMVGSTLDLELSAWVHGPNNVTRVLGDQILQIEQWHVEQREI